MSELFIKLGTAFVTALLFCVVTIKTLGAMQQSGYKTKTFLRWLRRGDNLLFNRLFVLALCLSIFSATTSLAFSFLGKTWALIISSVPFLAFLILFIIVDGKYALKIPYKATGRFVRLFVTYLLLVFAVNFGVIYLLWYLADVNGSTIYGHIAFAPFSLMPMALPILLCAANLLCSPLERARNQRYVSRAQKILDETQMLRIGIVGSYGKTSVKNVLTSILSAKYDVIATPASFNTPMGIARTVTGEEFSKKQVFIAEMGARKAGDIKQLCSLVRPNYAIFTGVCEQHISTFQTVENVFAEKSEIIASGAITVCGESLKGRISSRFGDESVNVVYANGVAVSDVELGATRTKCTITLADGQIRVDTPLLGRAAVENILLAVTLASRMGMTSAEIEKGLANVCQVPHRLQLLESNGVYILDDGYNCNPRGAEEALAALCRFTGRKCIVTPGIVECGVLEEKINAELGAKIAASKLDGAVLVGETLVGAVKNGYLANGGAAETLFSVKNLEEAKTWLADWLQEGDAVLFLNDLPDVY
ncbi:MAG: hypothetical protein E7355_05770 [Clostridiales bacterium]|nr:hypothetical protein [Clostridiales bacterium]